MRIWIDLANSPHVPFFRALANEFTERGHEIEITAREFAETVPLAEAAGLAPTVIGAHGGRDLAGKAGNLFQRAWALRAWASNRSFDLAVSHNSYSQILAARGLGVCSATLMDYEHQPANHLAFRLASRVIVPRAFPEADLARYGAGATRVRPTMALKRTYTLPTFRCPVSRRNLVLWVSHLMTCSCWCVLRARDALITVRERVVYRVAGTTSAQLR